MEDEKYLEQLKRRDDVLEAYLIIKSFNVVRRTKSGEPQFVTVQVFDAGPSADHHHRYFCRAEAQDGNATVGNMDNSVEEAIERIHWENLEK